MQNSRHGTYEAGLLAIIQKVSGVIAGVVILALAFPLGIFVYQARYVRYFADDFSTAEVLANQGFWQAQTYWYQTWTGSYTYTFLTALIELGGIQMTRLLPVLTMGLWVLLLFTVYGTIWKMIAIPVSNVWTGGLTLLVVFATIRSFTDHGQMIFWQTGIVAYQSNVLLFLVIAAYLLRRFWIRTDPVLRREYGLMFLFFFLAGGICETWVVMQVALFLLCLLVYLVFKRAHTRKGLLLMLGVGLAASCTALLVTLMAPGNANHASSMETVSASRVFYFLFVSLGDVFLFLGEWLGSRTILFGLVTVLCFCLGLLVPGQDARSLGLAGLAARLKFGLGVLVGGLLMLWAGLFPGFVVFGVRPPDRAIFPAFFVLLSAYALLAVLAGWTLGSASRKGVRGLLQAATALLLIPLLYLAPVRTGMSQVRLIPAFQLYARLWDERDALLRQAGAQGQLDVVVPSIRATPALSDLRDTIWLLGELEETPGNWKNVAAARYYGVRSITGER